MIGAAGGIFIRLESAHKGRRERDLEVNERRFIIFFNFIKNLFWLNEVNILPSVAKRLHCKINVYLGMLKKGIIFFLLGWLILDLQGQTPFSCEGQFYITLTNSSSSGLSEVTIDPISQNVVFRTVRSNMQVQINAIGYRSTDNLIYGVHPIEHYLYQVDRNGSVIQLDKLNLNSDYVYFAGDITPDGQYLILIGATNTGAPGSNGQDRELVRVNLEDSNYPTSTVPLSGLPVRMLDIAFDPISGNLYGYDSNDDRLMLVDMVTGAVTTNYARTPLLGFAGSLFFDAFGRLFAYGSVGGFSQNTLVQIDKERGKVTIEASGPSAQGTDACSCPYTIEMSKTVWPEITVGCSEVEYSFTIANSSGKLQSGIDFYDALPDGFSFVELKKNPFGGQLRSQTGDEELLIENMSVPQGIDTLIALVQVGEVSSGTYKNQAVLTNLSESLGGFRYSDNPATVVEADSTPLTVISLGTDDQYRSAYFCSGESATLDVTFPGATYAWSTGEETPTIAVNQGGLYAVEVTAGCGSIDVYYEVEEAFVQIEFEPDQYTIELGDSLYLEPKVTSNTTSLRYQWVVNEENFISCSNCRETWLLPLFSGDFYFNVTTEQNCQDEAFVQIEVEKPRRIYIPNAFSPNGDGINDVFYIMGNGFAKVTSIIIANRWGNIVYESGGCSINDSNCSWDGSYKGRSLNPGVFIYTAQVEFLDGATQQYSGLINLIK